MNWLKKRPRDAKTSEDLERGKRHKTGNAPAIASPKNAAQDTAALIAARQELAVLHAAMAALTVKTVASEDACLTPKKTLKRTRQAAAHTELRLRTQIVHDVVLIMFASNEVNIPNIIQHI